MKLLTIILSLLATSAAWAKLLFRPIIGADTPVMSGLDAIVKFNGKVVAYATNINFDEDFELQGVRTLGYHGDRDFKSMGYSLQITVGTFVLQGTVSDNLPVPDRQSILTAGLTDFELIDLVTGKTLYILQGAKCATIGVTFDSGSLTQKNTTWRGKNVKTVEVS